LPRTSLPGPKKLDGAALIHPTDFYAPPPYFLLTKPPFPRFCSAWRISSEKFATKVTKPVAKKHKLYIDIFFTKQ
jgi:hypothetical protein